MVKIQCQNCTEQWYVTDEKWMNIKSCPFCKNDIQITYDFPLDSFENLLKQVFFTQGLEILKYKNKFMTALKEVSGVNSKYEREIRLITNFCAKEMLVKFYECRENKDALKEAKEKAKNDMIYDGISEQWANTIVDTITDIIINFKNPNMCLPKNFELVELKKVASKEEKASRMCEESVQKEEKPKQMLKRQRKIVGVGENYIVGLQKDGTVVIGGDDKVFQHSVKSWKDIVEVAVRDTCIIGLKSNGEVVFTGENRFGRCNVSKWRDIVAISAGDYHTVGLRKDGTVVAVGHEGYGRCDVSAWSDIIAISAGYNHTVGLKSDGTVVAVGSNSAGQCNVKDWKDIIAVSAGGSMTDGSYTVGLKSDGTVIAVGSNQDGKCNISNWKNIVSISVGDSHTVGLKSDGTVVAVGSNLYGECNVTNLQDIIAISAGYHNTVGVKKDGMVFMSGKHIYSKGYTNGEIFGYGINCSAGTYEKMYL